jgi:hypothetical protein
VPKSRSRRSVPSHAPILPTAVVPSVEASPLPPAEVRRRLDELIAGGARVRPAGTAAQDPDKLLRGRYRATSLIELFGTLFFLSDYFQTPQLRFFVAYVSQTDESGGVRTIHPRIVYKDGSLVWRTASHMVSSDDDFWIGKGDVRSRIEGDDEIVESVESTTDLPFEMQTALEVVARRTVQIRKGATALDLVLRNAPPSRVRAYSDFTAPREQAARNPRNLVHGGRSIASFRRRRGGGKDPASLCIAKGFEPDFRGGILERAASSSVLYGGRLERYRILSVNRRIQYLFFAGPLQVWIIPPQATTTVLSSYGVRTVDVVVDDDLCCPGYEYHFLDDSEDPPVFYSQIPEGYAGEVGPHDKSRADASPWLDRMPVIREFRRVVLGGGKNKNKDKEKGRDKGAKARVQAPRRAARRALADSNKV